MLKSRFKNIMYDDCTKLKRTLYPTVYNVACENHTQAKTLIAQLEVEGFELVSELMPEYKNVLVNFQLKRIAGFNNKDKSTKKEIKLTLKEFELVVENELNKLNTGC